MSEPEEFIDVRELARRTSTGKSSWDKLRMSAGGPPFVDWQARCLSLEAGRSVAEHADPPLNIRSRADRMISAGERIAELEHQPEFRLNVRAQVTNSVRGVQRATSDAFPNWQPTRELTRRLIETVAASFAAATSSREGWPPLDPEIEAALSRLIAKMAEAEFEATAG